MSEGKRDSNIDMQAVILAGGAGKRMGELTKDKQKCMLEVEGIPIMEHILLGLKNIFGRKVEVIIATGYKGEEIKQRFGNDFNGIKLTYVHDDKPLETKGRMLLAKDLIVKPFFFLAGDILTPDPVLEQIATRFEQEQSREKSKVVGVLSGAKDHTPAPTHAVLSVCEGYLKNISFPPPSHISDKDLRETHRAIFSLDFLEMAQRSKEKFISRVIHDVVTNTDKKFGVEEFDGEWGHYVNPDDLKKYQSLPFLNKK